VDINLEYEKGGKGDGLTFEEFLKRSRTTPYPPRFRAKRGQLTRV